VRSGPDPQQIEHHGSREHLQKKGAGSEKFGHAAPVRLVEPEDVLLDSRQITTEKEKLDIRFAPLPGKPALVGMIHGQCLRNGGGGRRMVIE